jgi:Ethanolamine utilization protein EutJ (predicted chaperonin)
MSTHTTHRVAARYATADRDGLVVDHEPVLTVNQLQDELERRLGPLELLTIHSIPDGSGAATWEGITVGGSTVRGLVEMRTLWADGQVVAWPEIEIVGVVVGGDCP